MLVHQVVLLTSVLFEFAILGPDGCAGRVTDSENDSVGVSLRNTRLSEKNRLVGEDHGVVVSSEYVFALKLRLARDLCLLNENVIASLREDNGAICRHGITAVQVNHVSDSYVAKCDLRLEAVAEDLDWHVVIDLGRLIADLNEVFALGNAKSIATEDKHSDKDHDNHSQALEPPILVFIEVLVGHHDDSDDSEEEDVVEGHHAEFAL